MKVVDYVSSACFDNNAERDVKDKLTLAKELSFEISIYKNCELTELACWLLW